MKDQFASTLSLYHADFCAEDLPAIYSYRAQYDWGDDREPAGWYVHDVRLESCDLGGLTLTREQAVQIVGEAEIAAQESANADNIADACLAGDMRHAAE